jgi:GntR family transcriptional regulator, trigonelline degradation regulator
MNKKAPVARSRPAATPPSVIDNAVARLRKLIMTGELQPGQKLVEADLCRQLAVSRASVREALRVMENERLIALIPNRGPFVAKLGWQEIEDIHAVWAMLTSEAVYHFVEHVRDEDIAVIKRALTALQAALKQDDAFEQLAATNALFAAILDHCGNAVLVDIVYSLVSRLNFLRAQALRYEGWGHLCLHEIREIVAAIQARTPQLAREATRRHIDSACAAAKQVALLADAQQPPAKSRGRNGRSPHPSTRAA